jgi:hypothetical protein
VYRNPSASKLNNAAACSAVSNAYATVWYIGTATALVVGSASNPPCTAMVSVLWDTIGLYLDVAVSDGTIDDFTSIYLHAFDMSVLGGRTTENYLSPLVTYSGILPCITLTCKDLLIRNQRLEGVPLSEMHLAVSVV